MNRIALVPSPLPELKADFEAGIRSLAQTRPIKLAAMGEDERRTYIEETQKTLLKTVPRNHPKRGVLATAIWQNLSTVFAALEQQRAQRLSTEQIRELWPQTILSPMTNMLRAAVAAQSFDKKL